MAVHCFNCDNRNSKQISRLYGYDVCTDCVPTLGLLKDHTIEKHILAYKKAQRDIPENPSYKEEVDFRVAAMEKDYIKKRMKLLHIQARLKQMESD